MKTFIFDFDGVIVDSEHYWPEETYKVLQTIVPDLTQEQSYATMGRSAQDIYVYLQEEFALPLSLEDFYAAAVGIANNVYKRSLVTEGLTDFLANVESRFENVAIGTSGREQWIVPVLKQYDLFERFDCIVTSDDVPVGQAKPKPDIYLEVAKRLNVPAAECIVLEDSKNGVAAGLAAGMFTIGLLHLDNKQDVSAAHMVVESFADIDFDYIKDYAAIAWSESKCKWMYRTSCPPSLPTLNCNL